MRILIIEDDEQLCETLKLQFDHHGIETDFVHSGMDALYYVCHPVYDLIILDRMLPGMDGIALLKIIRENNVHTPIILATAVDSVEERIAGLDNGADDYLVKPYDIGELLARIRALCRRPDTMEASGTLLTFEDLEFSPANFDLSIKGVSAQARIRSYIFPAGRLFCWNIFFCIPTRLLPASLFTRGSGDLTARWRTEIWIPISIICANTCAL